MTGHRKFGERRQQLGTSPEYRELEQCRRAVQALEVVDAVQALTAVREARGVTQVEVAHAWGTTQSNVSRFEHAQDTYVSTLMRYAAALGGRLELRVVFPDQVVDLTPGAWRAVPVNEYFARCPELVLGRPTLRSGRYGPQWGVEPTGNWRGVASACPGLRPRQPEGGACEDMLTGRERQALVLSAESRTSKFRMYLACAPLETPPGGGSHNRDPPGVVDSPGVHRGSPRRLPASRVAARS